MASKKGAAGADSQKKRKRDKAEEVGRRKKQKSQDEAKTASAAAAAIALAKTTDAQTKGTLQRRPGAHRPSTWALSEPMGGSMAPVDPVFTADEAHLVLCYDTCLQVYSTADSLLERRIPLPTAKGDDNGERLLRRIVAAVLSTQEPELVWVACTDGALFRVNWASGAVQTMRRQRQQQTITQTEDSADDSIVDRPVAGMAVEQVPFTLGAREVLFLSEASGSSGEWQVTAYDTAALARVAGRTLFTTAGSSVGGSNSNTVVVELLRTAGSGRFVVGASGTKVFVGGWATAPASFAQLTYQVYALDAPDVVGCLDVRTAPTPPHDGLDLVVGCVRGALYVYGDIHGRLAGVRSGRSTTAVQPRKHHWHQRGVHAVKWSRDGHYLVSGGRETVLVQWQTDTGKLDFLPHLSASIENVVVSPRGAAYALRLDDNSALVLSTAELVPTCYVSGLQALVVSSPSTAGSRASAVRRVGEPSTPVSDLAVFRRPVPAVLHPADASRLLVRVGNGQQAQLGGSDLPSASLLQTFDLEAFRSIGRQPLARTNPTDAQHTVRGHALTEPTITHLCASRDGHWLASVDEWQPPERDMHGLVLPDGGVSAGKGLCNTGSWARSRREIHLRFWAVDNNAAAAGGESFALVSRIDAAHGTTQAEPILGVAADSRHANRFATLGDDATVRFWGIKTRVRDGLVARDGEGRPLIRWHCLQTVVLGNGERTRETGQRTPRTGALAFSDDGSTVFAALGGSDAHALNARHVDDDGTRDDSLALLYIIDAASGTVRGTLPNLFRGAVRGIAVLGPALVLLSADLRVYDLVADTLRYGVCLLASSGVAAESDRTAAAALTQLAVGHQSQTFAVAVPIRADVTHHRRRVGRLASRLLVFSPNHVQPLFTQDLTTLVVALLPSVGRSGFVAVDAAAQVWSLAEAGDTAALGQSLANLRLPSGEETPVAISDAADAADADVSDADEADEANEADDADNELDTAMAEAGHDDDEMGDVLVIPQQKLQDIFEAAPVSAATSIEDLFWQVSGLLAGGPAR